jgi:hypothetical protein
VQASPYLVAYIVVLVPIYLASEDGTLRYWSTTPLLTDDHHHYYQTKNRKMDGLNDFLDALFTLTY